MSYWNVYYTKVIICPYKLHYKYNIQYKLDVILNLVCLQIIKRWWIDTNNYYNFQIIIASMFSKPYIKNL